MSTERYRLRERVGQLLDHEIHPWVTGAPVGLVRREETRFHVCT